MITPNLSYFKTFKDIIIFNKPKCLTVGLMKAFKALAKKIFLWSFAKKHVRVSPLPHHTSITVRYWHCTALQYIGTLIPNAI